MESTGSLRGIGQGVNDDYGWHDLHGRLGDLGAVTGGVLHLPRSDAELILPFARSGARPAAAGTPARAKSGRRVDPRRLGKTPDGGAAAGTPGWPHWPGPFGIPAVAGRPLSERVQPRPAEPRNPFSPCPRTCQSGGPVCGDSTPALRERRRWHRASGHSPSVKGEKFVSRSK